MQITADYESASIFEENHVNPRISECTLLPKKISSGFRTLLQPNSFELCFFVRPDMEGTRLSGG